MNWNWLYLAMLVLLRSPQTGAKICSCAVCLCRLRLRGLVRSPVVEGLVWVVWARHKSRIASRVLAVGGVCRRCALWSWCWTLRGLSSIRDSCDRFGGLGGMCLRRFFSITPGLFLNLFLLCRILRNDRDKVRWNWRMELEAVCELLQVIQLDFLVIFRLRHASVLNDSPLPGRESLEGVCNVALNGRGSIRNTFRFDLRRCGTTRGGWCCGECSFRLWCSSKAGFGCSRWGSSFWL